jgi:hypothetical protein
MDFLIEKFNVEGEEQHTYLYKVEQGEYVFIEDVTGESIEDINNIILTYVEEDDDYIVSTERNPEILLSYEQLLHDESAEYDDDYLTEEYDYD